MMLCPLKFSRYEFEGGEECIGAECGFFGGVCNMDMSLSVQKCPNVATNGIDGETNGIRAGAPLVDEPPESDAIAHARWRWQYRPEDGDEVVMNEYNCKLLMSDLDAIADMVERDYKRRDDYDFVVDALKYMKAEHDKWKAKAEEAERAMNAAAGKWAKADEENRELRKMLLFDDGTVEEYTERADPLTALTYQKQLAEEWRDRCHNAEALCDKLEAERDELKRKEKQLSNELGLRDKAIELLQDVKQELIAERDEWKAKCEQAMESYADAKDARDTWHERYMALEGSSNVRVGQSNLEWLCKNAPSKLAKVISEGAVDCDWCAEDRLNNCSCECAKGHLEWLMAPHEDAHSKAQSTTESNMSEQSESLSDDVDSKPTFEAPLYGWHEGESDSREKLEADVSKWCLSHAYGDTGYTFIIKQLDRQATIVERECFERAAKSDWLGQHLHAVMAENRELQEKVDELTERKCPGYEPENHYCRYHAQDFELNSNTVSKLKREVAELTAELEARDKYPDGFVSHSEMMERVGELTEQLEAAHAKNRALKLHISKMQAGRHGWHVKGMELQRQVDELTAQLHASNAERERLRECLGIATDNAHDFLTLVDESGNVYDRDEGLA